MQLEEVGADPLDHVLDQRIVGIDHDRDRLDAARAIAASDAGRLELDIARALREEHQADIVGAGIDCRVHDHSRPHAANFHLHRHLADFLGWGCRALNKRPGGATLCNSGAEVYRSAT